MTIPKITPYTGGVANPDGSQTQTEFTQNMFDQLSYEAELSTELNNTVDGINDTATQVDADATSAAQSAVAAEAAASGLNYQGLWPGTGGIADKGDTYQTQVGGTPTGQYFTALQNTTVDPIGDDVNWRGVTHITHSSGFTVFATLAAALANPSAAADNSVFISEIETGKGGEVIADYVTGETPDGMSIFSHDTLALQLKLRPRAKKPMISFMFDDASVGHYEDVLPLAESYGFPISFAVTPKFTAELVGTNRCTINQLLDAQKRGVEIINHSMTHANLSTTTNLTRAVAEIETARQWLEDKGLNNVGYVAASSALNKDLIHAVSARMSYGLTVFANNNVDVAGITPNSDPYRLSRLTMDGVASSATIARIKEAVKFGKSIIAYDHVVVNPSSDYTNLVAVFDFLASASSLIDVVLPKDLVSKFIGIEMKQLQWKDESLVFDRAAGWSFSPGLGYVATDVGGNKQIELTPTVTGVQTGIYDVDIEPNKTYTFSNNIRSGSWTGTVSMGVHCLDSSASVIDDYSIESGGVEYDGENLQRHALEFHTPDNAVKARLFYRINPTIADNTKLLIRNPAVYTGRRVIYDRPEDVIAFDETEEVVIGAGYTPDLDTIPISANDPNHLFYFLRLDGTSEPINAPVNGNPTANSTITFVMRGNGVNRNPVFNDVYRTDPNTVFNVNATGDVMEVTFRYYRSEWMQVATTSFKP